MFEKAVVYLNLDINYNVFREEVLAPQNWHILRRYMVSIHLARLGNKSYLEFFRQGLWQ